MSSLEFEEIFLSLSSYIPDLIAQDFVHSPLSNRDLADAIRSTPIISYRIIEEDADHDAQAIHIVQPIVSIDSKGNEINTNVSILAEWVTLEFTDFSWRISLAFQDSIGLTSNYRAPYSCELCLNQLEECENIYDDDTATWDTKSNHIPSEIWWPEWWQDYDGPRLLIEGIHEVAITNFVFSVSNALAEAIARTSLEAMIEDSALQPLQMINYLWAEVAERIYPQSDY